jgi:uncharacterized protein YecT (DUF1311 family)
MKMLLAACVLWAIAGVVHADQPISDQQVLHRYCDKADTQSEMDVCARSALADADRQLNATYQAVIKKWAAFPDMISKLRVAQRQWLAYRDADIAARFANADRELATGTAGSAYPAAHSLYEAGLEFERTARLCEFLRGDAYGERDEAPCATLVAHPLVLPNP